MNTNEEVAESLVVDQLRRHCFSNCYLVDLGVASQLCIPIQQRQLCVLDLDEFGMLLAALGINEMLDFGHQELADSEEARSWRYLIAKRFANGSRCEWLSSQISRIMIAKTSCLLIEVKG